MNDAQTRLNKFIDEAAIRSTIARFGDAAMLADYEGFRSVWADDGEWMIGKPHEMRVCGVDDILEMLKKLRTTRGKQFFHLAVPGVIKIDGDEATTRSVCSEIARGTEDSHYRARGIFFDRLRRSGDEWVFVSRKWEYLWLDTSPFGGDMFVLPEQD